LKIASFSTTIQNSASLSMFSMSLIFGEIDFPEPIALQSIKSPFSLKVNLPITMPFEEALTFKEDRVTCNIAPKSSINVSETVCFSNAFTFI
jgi:hypothetical protein